jgi:signal transduction histidine kinase/ligand-binding sensor domain-containing protein/DNA-binding response OmpR family regulator
MNIIKVYSYPAIFLFTIVALLPGILSAQNALKDEIQFEQLVVGNESFQNTINCIYQDKKGYMWFASWSGLYKYDGLKLTLYKPEQSKPFPLRDRKIRKVFEDKKGNLWIGTMHEGLHKFDREKEEFIQYKNDPQDPESLSFNDVTEVFEDDKGNIWIGTVQGLNLLVSEKKGNARAVFKRIKVENENFAYDRINKIYQDKIGRMWIAAETGLYYFDTESDKKWPFIKLILPSANNYYNENHIYSIFETTSHYDKTILWLGTRAGLKKVTIDNKDRSWFLDYKVENITAEGKEPFNLTNNRVRALYQPKNDRKSIWIGTEDGLNRLEISTGKIFKYKTNYIDPNSLTNNLIYDIYEDRSGVLWIGTEKGINKLDLFKKQFKLYQAVENGSYSGLSDNFVTSLATGKSGEVWAGTSGGGLNKIIMDPQTGLPKHIVKVSIAEEEFKKFSKYIYSLIVDKKNRVWVSTNGGGIYRFNESDIINNKVMKYTHYLGDSYNTKALNDDYILNLFEDKKGRIWVATWSGGLIQYNEEQDSFIKFIENPDLPHSIWNYPITSIIDDFEGNIIFGTRGGGVFKLCENKGNWSYKPMVPPGSSNSLSNNFVNFLFEDNQRNIWIGTEGGLNLFERNIGKLTIISEKDGLPTDIMQAIEQDEKGNYWISTNKGLSRLSLRQKSRNKFRIRNYDSEDGLQGNIYNNNACAMTEKGVILFGGINGFNAFYPETITDNSNPPQVEITNFAIFNKTVQTGPDVNGRTVLEKPINETKEIQLKYNENSISFEFASLHFASPVKNKYAYRMTGFDEDWIYTMASRNMASYTNLDPGSYTLEVKASNNDGVWSKETAKINITIEPPLWKTPFAYFVYVLFILFIMYLLRSWLLMRVNYRHNLHLERVKREQVEMVNQLKIKFFTNVSHEIRTPLTLILGSLEKVLGSTGLNAKIYNQLLVMQKNGQMMLRLISELLDFRKIESGYLGLRSAPGNVVNFLNSIFISFKDLALSRQINYKFETESDEIPLFYDRDKLEKVIYNLLSNAFKFTKDRGNITLKVGVEDFSKIDALAISSEIQVFNTSYLKISVIDSGIGISKSELDKIFDLYFQAETKDPYHQNTGTGIGLALSKSMVDLHKGFLTVESEEGKGATFNVFLPTGSKHLSPSEIIEDFKGSEDRNNYLGFDEIRKSTEGYNDSGNIKEVSKDSPLILIVEDNNDVRSFIKQCFEEEYRILLATNGAEGLKIASEKIPDLIISDVIMPEMDGLEFCRRIKTNEKTCHIPLILLTARTSLIYKTEGLETGADDYITKPFNAQILTLKVRNLIKLKQSLNQKFANKKYFKPKEITTNSLDEQFLTKAIETINKEMHNVDFTTEDLGSELAMSRMQLYRKLKALTGLSPVEFIRSQRIQRAGQLLQNSQLTIAEITYEVGFTDLKYFRKCFKEYYNVNPSEFITKVNP